MKNAEDWIRFLRKYGPITKNGNMFDEDIQRTAKRTGIKPISFEHPLSNKLNACFDIASSNFRSVILTGAAGDGKTHLCRQVWRLLDGTDEAWTSDDPYLVAKVQHSSHGQLKFHFIRDLSAWVPQRGEAWQEDKEDLLLQFSRMLSDPKPKEYFLIAANDGQLIETWRRLSIKHCEAEGPLKLFEKLLVMGLEEEEGISLKFFNLSNFSSAELLDCSLQALLSHECWAMCFNGEAGESITFGSQSPIRRNYELLLEPLVQKRLRALFELCDYNGLHVPIREILLLLANAILGHPDCGAKLMIPNDVARVISNNSVAKASLYNNIFGGNLGVRKRESIPVFSHLNLLRIGYETTNRIDNLLIFGEEDEYHQSIFRQLIGSDEFYGADASYRSAQKEYIEGIDESGDNCVAFLKHLIAQRRALFFKIPEDQKMELRLWDLTVFMYAGEYQALVIGALKAGDMVKRHILSRIVKGLNRIWVGMLVESTRKLYLATGLSFSNAKVSRILEEEISVAPRLGQKVEIVLRNNKPELTVSLSLNNASSLPLNLIRFEFLSRVADGAMPNSFSKECYEDIMSFKSKLLTALDKQRPPVSDLEFNLLRIDSHGSPVSKMVEAFDV